jgi:hypothetical protein
MKHLIVIALVLLLSNLPDAAACVGCRQPGTSGPVEPQTIAAGIALSWGVLGMLAGVMLLVGSMTFYIVSTCRRLDRSRNNP